MDDPIENWFEQVDQAIVNLTNAVIRVQPQEEYRKVMGAIREVQGKVDCARAAIQAERRMVRGALREVNSALEANNVVLRAVARASGVDPDTIVAEQEGTSPPEEERDG